MNSSEKTAELLKLLGQYPYVHGVTELGKKIECGKSGTFNILSALVKSGLAAQTEDHRYTLGPSVYLLGKTYENQFGLSRLVKPYLVQLRDLTNENASFNMLLGGKAQLIYREESNHALRVVGKPGQERPLYAGATGKVLGAFQSDEEISERLIREPLIPFTEKTITSPTVLQEEYKKIREQGYAISDGELTAETIGVGAPIRDRSGKVWAAISLSAPKIRVNDAVLQRFIFLVQEFSKKMSENMMNGNIQR